MTEMVIPNVTLPHGDQNIISVPILLHYLSAIIMTTYTN